MKEKEYRFGLKLNVAAFLLATAGILCFPQILNLQENSLGFTNSIFSIFIWILCICAVKRSLYTVDLRNKRGWLIAGGFSFLFTVAMLFGVRLEAMENVDFADWKMWASIPVLTCLFAVLVRKCWDFLGGIGERRAMFAQYIKTPKFPGKLVKHVDMLTFFFLLLCWFPVLLGVYPGFFVYDAWSEWGEVASRSFSPHHPLLHVLLLGGIICAVHKFTDSYNIGIACYTLLQMVIVSGGFTYLLRFMKKKGVSRAFRIVSALYFAFFPVIVMFTLCSAKDALFTTALLILVLSILDMCNAREVFFASKRKMAVFVLSAATMMLLRNNGVYAFAVMACVLVFYHKKYLKKMAVLLVMAFLSYFLVNNGLIMALHAQEEAYQEILTVPIQQLTRTYHFNKEAFSPEDIDTLHEVLSEDALEQYRPKLSDPVKAYFQNDVFAANKSKYLGLWVKMGIKKPLSYINAWLMNSYGFWYPDTVIDVYRGNGTFTYIYEDSSYFGYEVEQPGLRVSRIPWIDGLYRKLSLEVWKEKVPVFSMLYSPGGIFWFIAFVFAYVLYRRKYHLMIPYLMVLLVWLTVILGPTYLPRYVLIFWYGLPLFVAMLLDEI